jgi:hypothetical protein
VSTGLWTAKSGQWPGGVHRLRGAVALPTTWPRAGGQCLRALPGDHRGRNAMAIYQDLVGDHGFAAKYASVCRFVARL